MVSKKKKRSPALSPKDAALALRVSQDTLQRWRSAGTGPRFSRIGREIRYAGVEIRKWSKRRGAASAVGFLLGLMVCTGKLFAQDPSVTQGPMTMIGPLNYCGVDTGSGNSYVCQNTSVSARQVKTLYKGNRYRFQATHANTGAATLAIDGLGSVAIKKMAGGSLTDLASGDIASGQMVDLIYDGSEFQYQAATANASVPPSGMVKSNGSALIDATAGTDYQAPIAANTYAPYAAVSQRVVYASKLVGSSDTQASVAEGSTTYGTDEAATFQAALTGGNVKLVIDGQYSISKSLALYSNTAIECSGPGNGLIFKPTVYSGPTQAYQGQIIGGTVFTNAHLNGPTIASTQGLSTGYGPGYEVSSVVDTNLSIKGCMLNTNGTNADITHPFFVQGLNFVGVSNVTLETDEIYDSPEYSFMFSNASDVRLKDVRSKWPIATGSLETHHDGAHFIGPDDSIFINNYTNENGSDDAIALNANDGFETSNSSPGTTGGGPSWGPITGVHVNGVRLKNTANGVRLLSTTALIDNVQIDDVEGVVYDTAMQAASPLQYGAGNGGAIGTVKIDGWKVAYATYPGTGPVYPVNADILLALNIHNFQMSHVAFMNPTAEQWPLFWVTNAPTNQGSSSTTGVDSITLSDWTINNQSGNANMPILFKTDLPVTAFNASNIQWFDNALSTATLFGGSNAPYDLNLTNFEGPVRNPLASGYTPHYYNYGIYNGTPVHLTPNDFSPQLSWVASNGAPPTVAYGFIGDMLFGSGNSTSTTYYAAYPATSTLVADISCENMYLPVSSEHSPNTCGTFMFDSTNGVVYLLSISDATINGGTPTSNYSAFIRLFSCPGTTASMASVGACSQIQTATIYPIYSQTNMHLKMAVSGGTLTISKSLDSGYAYFPLYTVTGLGTVSLAGVEGQYSYVDVNELVLQ